MFVIYNINTTKMVGGYLKRYATETAAKGALTKALNTGELVDDFRENFAIADAPTFFNNIEKVDVRKNLMSGKSIEVPVNTPVYLDPAKETYWSS